MKDRRTTRLPEYDYSKDALYFVTSCVKDRICCFGRIDNNLMILNESGKIAEKQWHWLIEQYYYVKSHAFIVMPNHIHAIIEINRGFAVGTGRDPSVQKREMVGTGGEMVGTGNKMVGTGDKMVGTGNKMVGTGRDLSLRNADGIFVGEGRDLPLPETKIKSLSELIGAYKTTTSKQIHLLPDVATGRDLSLQKFEWQRSFHDHIIRDDLSFENIRKYIVNNPTNWKEDKFYL